MLLIVNLFVTCVFMGIGGVALWMGVAPFLSRIKNGAWRPTSFQELYMNKARGELPLGAYITPNEPPMVDAVFWCILGAIGTAGGITILLQTISEL